MGKTYLRTRALVSVSPPQRIIYFRLGTRQKPQGLQLWSFNLKTHNFREELGLQGVFNYRRRFTMLQHNGEIYFMGGEDCRSGILTDEVHIFNLESQNWRFMQMVKRRCSFKAVVFNNSIYAVGGRLENPAGPEKRKLGTKTVEKLSLNSPSSKWEHDSFLLKSRSDAGVVVLDGKIYAIGGYVGEEKGEVMTSSRRCECFDPVVGKDKDKGQRWSPIAPMTYSRLGLAAVATSDRIFALGGAFTFDESDQGLKIVEIYDPETNSWKFGPPMIRRRKFFSAVLFDYCIYAIGGDCFSDEPTMEKFDLKTQKWTVVCNVKADGKFSTIAFS